MTITAGEPADGRVRDPRVRFYLDNYRIIETWAQLRGEADAALQDLLLDLVAILQDDAARQDEADLVVASDDRDARKPRIVLSRRQWSEPAGQPLAAVVIEWYNPIIDKEGDIHLYVGIRTWRSGRRGERIANRLSELAPALRRQLGRPWERESEAFPVWRWIEPTGDSCDEEELLEQARTAAWQCWAVAAPHIDLLASIERNGG